MTTYSVADAKNGLPRLIDAALAGEEVVITRHGKPVAELRPVRPSGQPACNLAEAHARFLAGRIMPRAGPIDSVELLNQIYEDPDA